MKSLDELYKAPLEQVASFRFDQHVAAVFNDMIQRSVPGYHLILSLLSVVTTHCVKNNTTCYDLGCSLGASTLAMRHHIHASNCQLIAIDNSSAMIEQCQKNIAIDKHKQPVEVILADILTHTFASPSSLFVLNFTLQFIPLAQRQLLLNRIANALVDEGVLVLSEKINFANPHEQDYLTALHHQFKQLNGYSALEISQKREALENVLIPETIEQHKQRLLNAGFSRVFVGLQCFNFVSFIAIK